MAAATDALSRISPWTGSIQEPAAGNMERPRSGCREAIRTVKPASYRWRTTCRPRNPVPPNTVADCVDIARPCPGALADPIRALDDFCHSIRFMASGVQPPSAAFLIDPERTFSSLELEHDA